jgi:hypothetical protein
MGYGDWPESGWKEETKVKDTVLIAKITVLNNYPLISIRK